MNIPNNLYEAMWCELRKLAGEQLREDILIIMDEIEGAIMADYEEQVLQKGEIK